MQKRRVKRRKPVIKRFDQDHTRKERTARAPAASGRLSAFYAAGPVVRLGSVQHPPENQHDQVDSAEEENIPQVHGKGIPYRSTAADNSIRLRGRTDDKFNGAHLKPETSMSGALQAVRTVQ